MKKILLSYALVTALVSNQAFGHDAEVTAKAAAVEVAKGDANLAVADNAVKVARQNVDAAKEHQEIATELATDAAALAQTSN